MSKNKNKVKFKDVTKLYYDDATPKRGNIDYDNNYNMGIISKNERRNMKLIYKNFGGDIFAIEHTNYDYVIADYIWNETYWELKNPKTIKGIDKLIQKGIKQILNNPGGIIVDIGHCNFSINNVIEKIEDRMFRKENRNISFDVIIVKENKIIKVIRY